MPKPSSNSNSRKRAEGTQDGKSKNKKRKNRLTTGDGTDDEDTGNEGRCDNNRSSRGEKSKTSRETRRVTMDEETVQDYQHDDNGKDGCGDTSSDDNDRGSEDEDKDNEEEVEEVDVSGKIPEDKRCNNGRGGNRNGTYIVMVVRSEFA
jgi:hypothetical protein